jgi:integrase
LNIQLIDEFVLDWKLSGKAAASVDAYAKDLTEFFTQTPEPCLTSTKSWLNQTPLVSRRLKKAQAIRAFSVWAVEHAITGFEWWRQVPIAKEKQLPQTTATKDDYLQAIKRTKNARDKAIIETLWSTGLRRGELCALLAEDIDFLAGFVLVRTSKTGKPRIVPLSPAAKRAIRTHLQGRKTNSVFGITPNGVRLLLQRLNAPSAHAWRRGWAVHALRNGVSETSVRAAAGWSSGAMVSRYTHALSGELAVDEFQRSWGTA